MFPGAMSEIHFDVAIDIFTDGASSFNGDQAAAKAGYAVVFPG
jgi:ribonuclease HI